MQDIIRILKEYYSSPLFWNRLSSIAMCIIAVELFLLYKKAGNKDEEPATIPVRVVSGNVDVNNSVRIYGSVNVDNTVDVNLEQVIGHTVGSHHSYNKDGKEYNAIDIYNSGGYVR